MGNKIIVQKGDISFFSKRINEIISRIKKRGENISIDYEISSEEEDIYKIGTDWVPDLKELYTYSLKLEIEYSIAATKTDIKKQKALINKCKKSNINKDIV